MSYKDMPARFHNVPGRLLDVLALGWQDKSEHDDIGPVWRLSRAIGKVTYSLYVDAERPEDRLVSSGKRYVLLCDCGSVGVGELLVTDNLEIVIRTILDC